LQGVTILEFPDRCSINFYDFALISKLISKKNLLMNIYFSNFKSSKDSSDSSLSIESNLSMDNSIFPVTCTQSVLSVSSSVFSEGSTAPKQSFDSQPKEHLTAAATEQENFRGS